MDTRSEKSTYTWRKRERRSQRARKSPEIETFSVSFFPAELGAKRASRSDRQREITTSSIATLDPTKLKRKIE